MKILLIIILPLLIILDSNGQCDCHSNFLWLKNTFENNDAGFTIHLEKNGKEAYLNLNAETEARAKKIETKQLCTELLRSWLRFFRNGHLNLYATSSNDDTQLTDRQIIDKYSSWQTIDHDPVLFDEYMSKLNSNNPGFEGVWYSDPYTIAIIKKGKEWIGYVLEADGVYWRRGQVKLKINEKNEAVFYMQNHSPRMINSVTLIGYNALRFDNLISLQRVKPYFEESEQIENYVKLLTGLDPYLSTISQNTILLRIPSFNYSYKKKLDSLLKANHQIIVETPNLIIDIRNNGGGSDATYTELLKYLYTNPILTVGVEFLSTPLNNQRMKEFSENPQFAEEFREWSAASFEDLNKRIGEFVNLQGSVHTYTIDDMYDLPENIAIVINENNGSTAEQFLLAAKQSKKVKLFGRTTKGVLDIGNLYNVSSPCGEFVLQYGLSRSMRLPDMTVDGIGIQPDFYLRIPSYEWITYIHQLLNKW